MSTKFKDNQTDKSSESSDSEKETDSEDKENEIIAFEDLPEINYDENPEFEGEDIAWRFPRLYKKNKKGDVIFWEIGFDGKYLRTRAGKHGTNKRANLIK